MANHKQKRSSKIIWLLLVGIAVLFSLLFLRFSVDEVVPDNVSVLLSKQSSFIFEPVLPDNPVELPRDYSIHPEYQHEWWYFNANLISESGETFAVQWTLFRLATDDRETRGWKNPQIYMAHVVITSKDQRWIAQRIARGGIGQAGVSGQPFRSWIDDWAWQGIGRTPFPGNILAGNDEFKLNLAVRKDGPAFLQGDKGYSKKHDLLPIASHYFNVPFIKVRGELYLDGNTFKVSGNGWLDREWSTDLFVKEQQGWDWFSFNLDDGRALMVSQYRHKNQQPYLFGSIMSPDGKYVLLGNEDIVMTPLSESKLENGKRLPLRWQIKIKEQRINLITEPVREEQWLPFLVEYWEGPIIASGSHKAKGFMELVGY
ncbi:MAG: carotenoid 1,2-hydratase [Aliivibrio sp.]|uniref:lipocalin-like domain-containing protein n=1 Tax=Aliivibrio sp. TaxID=1872443 RepID=UPI001A460053|nr:carotenoid 1,2-hydratase [Aliivibrio sp.]